MGLLSRMSRAATALTKYYIPYTWRNKPSIVSPVNEVNLNHIEDGINELDNRILILAQNSSSFHLLLQVVREFFGRPISSQESRDAVVMLHYSF